MAFADAIGMVGQRLEANVHLVTSSVAATQNLVTAANKAGILIRHRPRTLASAESCLTQDERDMGCCLLDVGGGTAELIVYGGGVCGTPARFPSRRPLQRMTSRRLAHSYSEAERLKRRHGCAASALMKEDGAIEIASVGDRPPRTIFAHMLTDIIEPRAMELTFADPRRLEACGAGWPDSCRICHGGRWRAPARARRTCGALLPFACAHWGAKGLG